MWCIELDDIAFINPKKASEVDPTLKEMLNVVNNTPFVPSQASLENKGKTPIRAELVIATTNKLNINANEYFSCPLAVQRRLPFIITIEPNDMTRGENGMIDPKKLETKTGEYPNFWRITLSELEPYQDLDGTQKAKIVSKKVYDDVNDFLADYSASFLQHEQNQQSALGCDKFMSDVIICGECHRSANSCKCVRVQAEDEDDELRAPEWVVAERQHNLWTAIWYCITMVWYWVRFALNYSTYWFITILFPKWIMSKIMNYYFGRSVVYRLATVTSAGDMSGIVVPYLNSVCTSTPELKAFADNLRKASKYMLIGMGLLGIGATAYAGGKIYSKAHAHPDPKPVTKQVKSGNSSTKVHDYGITEQERDQMIMLLASLKDGKITESTVESWQTKDWVQEDSMEVQGNKFGTTEEQLAKEESQNVWYNPTVEITSFDLPKPSRSLASIDKNDFRDIVANNLVRLESVTETDGVTRRRTTCGVYLSSHYVLANAHLLREEATEWNVTIYRSRPEQGLTDQITFRVCPRDVAMRRDRDLCMFKVLNAPACKDIFKFWAVKPLPLSCMWEILREQNGNVIVRDMYGMNEVQNMRIEELKMTTKVAMGVLSQDNVTKSGDCGALGVVATPKGPAIYGIHVLGGGSNAGVMCVEKENLEEMMKELDDKDLYPVTVQGGGEPSLSSHGITRMLGGLHHRSVTRYLPKGTLHVYGTFQGFRPNFKSKVCQTPVCEKVCEYYNCEVDHGKPVMRGYEPWKKNLEKMIRPNCNVKQDVLRDAAEGYLNDVIRDLPVGWEKELVELSDKAAVNGLPGVKFIDKLNRKSSMGFPWNTTKKNYLLSDADERYPEGVTFDDEFWERVHNMEARYGDNQRCFPIFSGALKDTPTPFKKIEMKKTRVFTGAPADFGVVVRKKLLSFIRLVQKNKFAFEAGPGTVCQSTEWGQIYKYVTHFGEDRIFAGDFGSYDKFMIAIFIMTAFSIIARMFEIAGFDKAYCDSIIAIGEDTAFSWVNFNGDLYEFFGTNPSGHPLTVIINSIVNSLYMRYCYHETNPKSECATFKKFVHLFTYGDDNMQGVSRLINWYNHTSVSAVLANIGVEYTMADKESESVPYINIKDVSFLKRKWRWDEDVGAWLAPIEEASIRRSLTVWLPSESVTAPVQLVDVVMSAINEYFFYGKKVFEQKRAFLLSLLEEEPYCRILDSKHVPTWDEEVERFHEASRRLCH
jgi:hypothetical protein